METKETETTTPRAWVGCLGCYNAGTLNGSWVDGLEAATDGEGFLVDEDGRCDKCGSDEPWVFDHEGFGPLLRGESSPDGAQDKAELLEAVEANGSPVDAFLAYADHVGAEHAEPEDFEEAYAGEWDDFEAYAYELGEDIGLLVDVPEAVARYFAWDRWARDLVLGGDYWTAPAPGYGVYVFRAV